MGFAGIYGSNDPVTRTTLWTELANTLDTLFLGDFNIVKAFSDCVGGEGHIIRGRESRGWTNLVGKFNMEE